MDPKAQGEETHRLRKFREVEKHDNVKQQLIGWMQLCRLLRTHFWAPKILDTLF